MLQCNCDQTPLATRVGHFSHPQTCDVILHPGALTLFWMIKWNIEFWCDCIVVWQLSNSYIYEIYNREQRMSEPTLGVTPTPSQCAGTRIIWDLKKYSNINNQVGNHIADAEKRYIRIGLVWRWTPELVAHSNFVWIPNVVCEVHDMTIPTHLQIFQPSFDCGCCITPKPVNALSCDGTSQFILSWFYYFLTAITFIYIYIYIYIYMIFIMANQP